MSDVLSERRGEALSDGQGRHSVVDMDVHEMLTSIKDLVPYLAEPDSHQRWVQGTPGKSLRISAADGRGDTGRRHG
jgi:hypothetical protein